MSDFLNPSHIQKCRREILDRFAESNVAPGQGRRYVCFVDIHGRYPGGYFQAALDLLVKEGFLGVEGDFFRRR